MSRPTQAEVLAFTHRHWPERVSVSWRAMKLAEEAGEVLGAVNKLHVTTHGVTSKTEADLAQETAQVVICAMALAEAAGFDLDAEIAAEWERAQVRFGQGTVMEPVVCSCGAKPGALHEIVCPVIEAASQSPNLEREV